MPDALLSADIAAVAELMRSYALEGRAMPAEGCNFVAGALDQLTIEARTLEDGLRRATCHLAAADARIEALSTPDLVAKVQRDLAIAAGKRAGAVFDLRPYLDREWTVTGREPGDAA